MFYTISETPEGFECDCTSFLMGKRPCKHIALFGKCQAIKEVKEFKEYAQNPQRKPRK